VRVGDGVMLSAYCAVCRTKQWCPSARMQGEGSKVRYSIRQGAAAVSWYLKLSIDPLGSGRAVNRSFNLRQSRSFLQASTQCYDTVPSCSPLNFGRPIL